MPDYLTTRELAAYLRLNEKRVYALVSEGGLPAVRISGKWLFPKHLVDEWLDKHTTHPAGGLIGAVLDELVVVQGSDDHLFSRVAERFTAVRDVPVVSAQVGSLAGVAAIARGRAHVAGCHVQNDQVKGALGGAGCYLVNLFDRQQGLILDRQRHPGIESLAAALAAGLRLAGRQPLSGTHKLACRLIDQAGPAAASERVAWVGPYATHLELALAVKNGQADAGLGIRIAAESCGLDFVPLVKEAYKLAIPAPLFAHPQMTAFLQLVLDELEASARQGVSGYEFPRLGRLESISIPQP